MALDLPTLVQKVRVGADTQAGEREATSSLQRIGGTATKVGIGMTAGLTVPILAMAKAGVTAASDLAESNSKVGVVFEDNADKVRAFAETASESLGMSEQKALEATGTFGNLFRALGTGSDDAARMSTELVTLAADLASFNNANPEDVLLALRSGLLGEAEPLRQFGVSLSAARIEAEALASGLIKPTQNLTKVTEATLKVEEANYKLQKAMKESGAGSWEVEKATLAVTKAEEAMAAATEGSVGELTAAQKAQAAYQVIMKDTALAQGDFARTSDGLANRQRIVAAQFEDTKAALGEALLPAVESGVSVIQKLLGAFNDLSPAMQETVGKVGLVVAAMGPALIVAGKLATATHALRAAFAAKAIASAAAATATTAQTGATVAAQAASKGLLATMAPFLPVVIALAAAGFLIYKNWDKIKPVFEAIKSVATQLFGVLFKGDFTGGFLTEDSPIIDGAFKIREAIVEGLGKARKVISDVSSALKDRFQPVVENVVGFVKANARPILIGLGVAIAALVAPVATGVAALVFAYKKIEVFRNVVDKAAQILTKVVVPAVVDFGKTIVSWFQGKAIPAISDFATKVVGFLLRTVVPAVSSFASSVGRLAGDAIRWFQTIAPQVQEALGHVIAVVQAILGILAPIFRVTFSVVTETVSGSLDAVRTIIETVLGVVAVLWRAWGDDILNMVQTAFKTIYEVVNAALDIVRGVIQTVLALINGEWGMAWDSILQVLRGVWDLIFGVLRGAVSQVSSILGGIVSLFGEIFRPVGNFLHTWVIQPVEDMVGFFVKLPGRIASATAGAFNGLKEAFKSAANFIIRGWNGLEFKIPGFDPPGPGPKFNGFTLGVPKIKELALGGRSIPGQPFFAGERGTELVDPGFKGSAQVLNADRSERLLRQIAGGVGQDRQGDTFTATIETVDRRSGEQLGRDLAWGWASARGAPLDYETAGV